jgi:IgA Peptidase M64/Peptidase M64 N-terminus
MAAMKRALIFVVLFFAAVVFAATPRTMRVDYYHTGNSSTEMFSLDEVVIEPLPWPGNPDKAIDDTNLGKYYFEVRDRATNNLLYSRGFSSIYGEWETTDEAKKMNRTFSESLRFPAPEKPVQIILKKRDKENTFREIWSVNVDPKNMFVNTAKPPETGPVIEIEKHGDPAKKVDFLILGDGYTAAERGKCEKDAHRLTDILFSTEPFKSRRTDFNVWAICAASQDSGISRPSTGVHHRTAIGASYDAFGSERYVLTFENKKFREIASWAPYEFVEILANNNTYGGGGIFNLYSTVAADSLWAPYVFVHEFGHHFAGLADEYYTSDVAYEAPEEKIEPWEPNATALLNPELLKWKQYVTPGTPIPTPWSKTEFENYEREIQKRRRELRKENRPEAEMDALFKEEKAQEDKMFAEEKYAGKVGAFEGANYEAKGYYRPEVNCIMFTRANYFCKVCQGAIERVIDLYSKP